MQEFIKISILLSTYGIFKEFRPSEPYLVPLMTAPPLNFTSEQISQEIFPVSTYTTFFLLVIVFLITDYLRYKPIIILQAICAITTYLMIIFGRGVFQLQIMQAIYGFFLAGEVGYFTYIYAKVDKEHFQEVTSYTRAAYLLGKSLSGIVSQVAVYYNLLSYTTLLWITVGSEGMVFVWAIFLPSVDKSMYFHRKVSEGNKTVADKNSPKNNTAHSLKEVMKFMWNDLTTAFNNKYVLKWAFWWALATCGYFMTTSYIQVLWKVVRKESQETGVQFNGTVEAVYTLLGALASMAVGKLNLNWQRLGEPLLAICSLLEAVLLYTASIAQSVTVSYVTFILFTITYQTMITVSNSEVAKHVNRDSYGLVFGITTFVVYLIQSVFTYIALQVFKLEVRVQFEVYAIYYGALGLFFVFTVVSRCIFSSQTEAVSQTRC